jgi:hypothetical protein
MRQNNLNEKSGHPIGSAKEASYLKELDSNKEVKEKLDKKKRDRVIRFYGCEPKQMPQQNISKNLDKQNGLSIQRPKRLGNLNE